MASTDGVTATQLHASESEASSFEKDISIQNEAAHWFHLQNQISHRK